MTLRVSKLWGLAAGLLLIVLLVAAAAGAAPGSATGSRSGARLDPALKWLLKQAEKEKEIDLAPLAGLFAVYRDNRPVTVPMFRPSQTGMLVPGVPSQGSAGGQGLKPSGAGAGSVASRGVPADRFGVFVITDNPGVLASVGARPNTVAGNVVTAHLTLDQIRRLKDAPGVQAIRLGRRVRLTLDRSVPEIGAQVLQTMQPFLRGKGVISGAVDTGISYLHKDFRAPKGPGDQEELASRILFIWDQMPGISYFGAGWPMPCAPADCPHNPPAGFDYGTEYTKAQIEQDIASGVRDAYDPRAIVKAVDDYGHGTHVAGIQASDGSSQPAGYPARYVGMAPDSDIIMVRTTLHDTDIVDGVAYIFRKADELGRPAVVNLSLGGQFGPHDGTEAFDLAVSNLASKPGRIVVVSAGNEGSDRIHAGAEVTAGGPATSARLTLPDADPSTPGNQPDPDGYAISLWYPEASRFTVSLTSPGGHTYSAAWGTEPEAPVVTPDGCILVSNGPPALASIGSVQSETTANQVEIEVLGSQGAPGCPADAATGTWTLTVSPGASSPAGRWDGWIYFGNATFDVQYADPNMTVGSPGVAKGVITVGAYMTRDRWQSINGNVVVPRTEPVGSYAPFTSRGPTRDGRQKPEVSAPGSWIVATAAKESDLYAATNSTFGPQYLVVPDREHLSLQGTSMAAPHVAGLAAQMLQAVPGLTTPDVRDLLTSTARSDLYTGVTPNVVWGYGKISADRAYAAEVSPRQFAIRVGPNPAREVATFYYSLDRDYPFVTLLVYTVAGQRVYEQPLPSTAGSHFVHWNLTNTSGQPLATGMYLFVLKAGERTSTGKLLVAR
ncbi:S8 family serine peptidase [Carboxydochorda subterranea]|uniref:S8 family serine peptidase n=1 Tax=Carboxydichorda subterranea TaxID=3109565 RepID=A0ABZ1BVR6_9FIRM|nr:S8 family serine peptidase [Limnochorda sp. L945t]WRP16258.1 S8 family serine peptidase [Limnochorda sp. L945t]